MTYRRPDLPSGANDLIWWVLFALLLLAVSAFVPRSCYGEMIFSNGFKGIATDKQPQALTWEQARKSVGWLYLDGNLERETFDQLSTGTAAANGLTWLALYSPLDRILFYDNDLRRYSIDADVSASISGETAESVTMTQGDSTVERNAVGRWLNLALTDRGTNNTVTLNGVTYTVLHFYSDTMLWLTKGVVEASDATTDLMFGFAFNPLTAGSFETDDTLWLFDGTNLTPYTGTPFTGFAYPTYADSGTYDSVLTAASGDSLQIYGNFATTIQGKYILWEDSLWSRRAIPMYVKTLVGNGTGTERIVVLCDSAMYVGQNHFGTVANPGVSGPVGRRYIAHDFSFGAGGIYDTAVSFAAGRVDLIGTHGNMKYYRLSLASPPVRWRNERAMDAALYRISSTSGSVANEKMFTLKIDSCYGADSTIIYAFGHSSQSLTTATAQSITIYRHTPVEFGTEASQQEHPYSIGALHRRRAWWAGNDTGVTIWAWSDQAHYDTVVGSERLEGRSAITSLISSGQEITAIRENQSVLRGPVAGAQLDNSETITGFSEDDFYKTPISAILSGNFTISPLGLGMFSGGAIQPISTDCNTIFSDSINWAAGERIVAAIYQDRLWLGLPFGTSATNNRCLVVDPGTQPVTVGFVGAVDPGSFLVRRDAETDEQLYIGQADTNYLWLAGGTADRYEVADWRSGWYDGGGLSARKLVRNYVIDLSGTSGDSVWIDFYTDFSETVIWSDTIVLTASGSRPFYAAVGRAVQGYAVAYGIRSPDAVVITGFGWDVVAAGRVRKQ